MKKSKFRKLYKFKIKYLENKISKDITYNPKNFKDVNTMSSFQIIEMVCEFYANYNVLISNKLFNSLNNYFKNFIKKYDFNTENLEFIYIDYIILYIKKYLNNKM